LYYLSQHFSVVGISYGRVAKEVGKDLDDAVSFPYKQKLFRPFFSFWAIYNGIKLFRLHPEIKLVYSTYEPVSIILSFLIARLYKRAWIVDLWDDPEKFLLNAKSFSTSYHLIHFVNIVVKRISFLSAKELLKQADEVIIGLVPEIIRNKYGLNNKKCLYVTNGINLNYKYPKVIPEKPIDCSSFRIFYCGVIDCVRLECVKPVFEKLSERVPKIVVCVVGAYTKDNEIWLKKELCYLEGKAELKIYGEQPYDFVLQLISKSDVCICPYPDKLDLAAAYPVKMFDYMMMGKPIVASQLPGIARIVTHGEDALLFEPGDYDEMACHLYDIYLSEKTRTKLSLNARYNVLKYSWTRINGYIIQFIRNSFENNL
jgi:glycosyltransferase involved in cell wall biosynthesis